jgi:hypothetical protein
VNRIERRLKDKVLEISDLTANQERKKPTLKQVKQKQNNVKKVRYEGYVGIP